MMETFIRHAQSHFVQLRDIASNFSESLSEAVAKHITQMVVSGAANDIPKELQECIDDREAIRKLEAGMEAYHIEKIDAREDKLMFRGNDWVAHLIDDLKKYFKII